MKFRIPRKRNDKKMKKQPIQYQTISSHPITIGNSTITPQSQALIIRWPYGGFVWNRPRAILVERAGQTQRIPIIDATRIVQVRLWGLGLLCAILIYLSSKRDN